VARELAPVGQHADVAEARDLLDPDVDRASAVASDTPIERLLASEPLRRLGALMVVDREQRLCGVVTLDQVRRALTASAPGRLA
jgi:CBS-domain-containing membrane protein